MIQRILTAVAVSLAVVAGVCLPAEGARAGEPSTVDLVIFYGEGCPYCAAELEFLDRSTCPCSYWTSCCCSARP